MPRLGKLNNSTLKKKNKNLELSCSMCGQIKKSTEFYQSWNPLHKTQKLPFCKQCLKEMCYDKDGNIDVEKTKEMLKAIDRPFLYEILKASAEDKMDTIGGYFKNLGMPQYRYLGWKESIFEPHLEEKKDREVIYKSVVDFEATEEIKDFFGLGFSDEEYQAMDKKYNFLKNNYPEKTNMHIEALKSYVRFKVKEEMSVAEGDVGSAGKWADLASKAATAAKINPSQLTKADLSDGLSTFSELSQAVEREVDIIPILPKFKYRPNDALDFNIWCYVNYMRDMQGLPPCKYEDIYSFYDKRKQDYIEQYGDPYDIFTDDTTEKNRENIVKFIKEEGE